MGLHFGVKFFVVFFFEDADEALPPPKRKNERPVEIIIPSTGRDVIHSPHSRENLSATTDPHSIVLLDNAPKVGTSEKDIPSFFCIKFIVTLVVVTIGPNFILICVCVFFFNLFFSFKERY